MAERTVIIDGQTVVIADKEERPRAMMLSESVAVINGAGDDKIEVVRNATHPFMFEVRGKHSLAKLDISALMESIGKVVYEHDTNYGKKEKLSNHRICVSQLGSGWAAVHMVDVTTHGGTYSDVQQTGIGRYETRAEAVEEAVSWSVNDVIPLDPSLKIV